MLTLLELSNSIFVFFVIDYLVYLIIENDKIPSWLQYKPFVCRKCASFWALVFAYVVIGISFKLWYFLGCGLILASLNALAMHLDEKNTISLQEWDERNGEE